jgi:hypothetical protein
MAAAGETPCFARPGKETERSTLCAREMRVCPRACPRGRDERENAWAGRPRNSRIIKAFNI